MKIIGLTGGIAMGKSTVSKMFEQSGVPVWCYDSTIHQGYETHDIRKFVFDHFPTAYQNGRVDRPTLRQILFADDNAMAKLQQVMHFYADQKLTEFLNNATTEMVMLDVPLLYETSIDKRCDVVITVSCPPHIQKERAMAREGMTEETLQCFIDRQMDNDARCDLADMIIKTDVSLALVGKRVAACIAKVGKL